jgi:transaldolase
MTKIFLDGGDPAESKKANELLLSFGLYGIEGQTTNPSLIAKRAATGGKISPDQAYEFYRQTVVEMSKYISGPISIQVLSNESTTSAEMLKDAREKITWIPSGVIKFPCTKIGLEAVETFCQEGPVNITLVFSEAQAAAVYQATKQHKQNVFISPFVGRLDNLGENGMDVVANILKLYSLGDDHVQVICASVRNINQFLDAIKLGSHVVTVPIQVLEEWASGGCKLPGDDFVYDTSNLKPIEYHELSLNENWQTFSIHHDLTEAGVAKFWTDWQSVLI